MTFTPKAWHDSPNTTTPLDAGGLVDLETRLAGYADTIGRDSLTGINVTDPQWAGGAKGDGVTDDSAAFVAALATGADVFVPSGTYILSDVFYHSEHQRIYGAGRSTTILKAKAGATAVLRIEGLRYCGLEEVTINGNNYASKGLITAAGSVSGTSQDQTLKRVAFTKCLIGWYIPNQGVTQADKNTAFATYFLDNTTAFKSDSVNSQETVFLGVCVDFAANNQTGFHLAAVGGGACLTVIGGQAQGAFTGTTAIKVTGINLGWIKLQDWIDEGPEVSIDGSVTWPFQGVSLEHCTLQGSVANIRMGPVNAGTIGGILHARQCRFNGAGVGGGSIVSYSPEPTIPPKAVLDDCNFFVTAPVFSTSGGGAPVTVRAVATTANYAMPLAGDNAAALTSAIADAAARGGDTIEVRSGIHGFASAVSVPSLVNIVGRGKSTIFRATGNNYILAPTGTGSRISNLKLDATSSQASGGGINFASLGSDVTIDNLTIGNNLFYTFDLRPTNSGRGIVWIDRIRFDVVTGHNTPFKIGDGTHLVTDIFLSRIGGTASTNPDVVQWFNILNNVDTLYVKDCDFYQGTAAMNLGNGGASGSVTGSKWTNVSFDSMGTTGVVIAKCRSLDWTDCTLSTIGGTGPGLQIAANAVGFNAKGGLVQNCNADGIDINAGSQYTDIMDVQVSDNNQGGAAFGAGIGVSAGATEFNIASCRSGNFLLGTAAQQRGIWVVAGGSDHYMLVNNRTPGNSISGLIDGGSGVNKTVTGNL